MSGEPETPAAPETPAIPKPPNRRVKAPTLLQMEAVECGAAALGIVLGYFGKTVPLEELRVECGVSRDGSKANNVLKAARKYGLTAKGFKYDELAKLYDLPLPIILFWNMNHFLVLEGFRGGKAYLNDPAQGPRKITMEELNSSYSGVVLTFEPGPEFSKGGDKPSMRRALTRRLSDSKLALLYVMLCGLFLVAPGLVAPTFTRIFIDDYLIGNREYVVKPLLWSMGITTVFMMLLTWLQKYYLLRLETKLSLLHSSRFFAHLQRLPIPYFVQRYAGEIGSRVAINDRVANVIGTKLTSTTIDLCVVFFYLALMLWYDVPLTLVVVAVTALNVLSIKLVARIRTDVSRRLLLDKGKLQGTAMGGLQMIETLKATGGEAEFFARWAGYQAKSLLGDQTLSLLSETTSAVPVAVTSLATMTVYVMGGYRVMSGVMTVGMLVAYQTLVGSFTRPLSNLVNFSGMLQELEGDMNRLDDVLRYPRDPQYTRQIPERTAQDDSAVKLSGRVELRDIAFGYSPLDPPLIEDFNLTIEPGQRVALVGGSGSGKSTVAKLVSGLYEPWKGQVLFDGVPRTELPRALITNSVGVVDQEVFLFGGTITENVSMWDNTLSASRIAQACRDAALEDVIEGREGRYESIIDEGGKNLSGGQRQRLEIARALAGEPSIVILDEATSALDPTTETLIDESLRRRGCTCIIIAHRLSTIRDADKILVMQRGKVVQQGTHDEMKVIDGPYKSLISVG
ncbi:MAG TPA: NHLP family bacteriocin export ABC transporter peptidase/permease/ATPase subunit [Vicinamibacterales bacterium]|jgi:NHLM bacteriocin system ABC transporter peptidase/ATP-binding protein